MDSGRTKNFSEQEEVSGEDIKGSENQKFKEELTEFIMEKQKRHDGLRDLLWQWDTGLINGKELRSKLNLFRRSYRQEMNTLNHLIGMAERVTRHEGKEVNHSGVFNRPMAKKEGKT